MSKIYVYSTLTCANSYGQWVKGGADLPTRPEAVIINGGAGVVHSKHMMTPRGAVTEITPHQLEICRADVTFQHHEKNGYITVSEASEDADKVADSMEGRDNSAPLVPQDIADDAPTVVLNLPEVIKTPSTPRGNRGGRNRNN